MMKHITLTMMLLAAAVAAAGFAEPLRADARGDLRAALDELKKKPAEQDTALIDARLASAVEASGNLPIWQYHQARMLQEQRRVAALVDKTAPEKRQALNDAYAAIVGQADRLYLPDVAMRPYNRFSAYRQQLNVVNRITLSTQAESLAKNLVETIVADLDTRYLADTELTAEQKEQAIQQARRVAGSIRDRSVRSKFEMGIYGRLIALGAVNGKKARIDRAKLQAAGGDMEAARKDFDAIIQDAEASEDLKRLARFERMKVLAGRELWSEAMADAEALSVLSVKDASAEGFFVPAVAADAKRRAIRVKFANAKLDSAQFSRAIDVLWLDVLTVKNLSGEEKSRFLAEMAMERAKGLSGRQQWAAALAWVKVAYDIAPNRSVSGSVTLIQQILANRSRRSFANGGVSVAKKPADLAAAEAFYLRQSGVKQISATDGAKAVTVALKADLSNTAAFPRQLDDVATPLAGEIKTSVEQVAAGHDDLQTRALAYGLLGDADKAIKAMGQAIDALELESSDTAGHVNFMARFVRAKCESIALANAFLESQVYGPAGKDGQLGTEDDKPNPLATKE